jgi:NADH-quinone oxidoreductase subunit G
LRDELSRDGSGDLVGERLATAPGALSAAAALAERTGARLAAGAAARGERGAVDSGAVPALLPGGRLVSDDKSRIEIGVWAASVPIAPDVTFPDLARRDGELAALVVSGLGPATSHDPALAAEAEDGSVS